jgi:hypothetical protein
MTGSSVSAVTAYNAHREWTSRPPDERCASVHALYEAARARHARIEERSVETGSFRTEALDGRFRVQRGGRAHDENRRTPNAVPTRGRAVTPDLQSLQVAELSNVLPETGAL